MLSYLKKKKKLLLIDLLRYDSWKLQFNWRCSFMGKKQLKRAYFSAMTALGRGARKFWPALYRSIIGVGVGLRVSSQSQRVRICPASTLISMKLERILCFCWIEFQSHCDFKNPHRSRSVYKLINYFFLPPFFLSFFFSVIDGNFLMRSVCWVLHFWSFRFYSVKILGPFTYFKIIFRTFFLFWKKKIK